MSLPPVFILAVPDTASALLTAALGNSTGVVKSAGAFDATIASLCGSAVRPSADAATPEVVAALLEQLARIAPASRLLDASPDNVQRIPFLHAVFPEAKFVCLFREPRHTIRAQQPGNATATQAAEQWCAETSPLLDDLEALPRKAWLVADAQQLLQTPARVIAQLAVSLALDWSGRLPPLPDLEHPDPEESTAASRQIDETTRPIAERARALFGASLPRLIATPERAVPLTETEVAPFRSVSTQSLPDLLQKLGISLVISTYQSGRLILVRAESATALNTHFRMFRSPMGIAAGPARLAVGTEREVWEYRNQPALAAKIEPVGKHDACFVPRKIHVTGDIRIHEIAYASSTGKVADSELWIVNTRFSSLCTLDKDSSFVPRWRPPFVTHLAPEDRCHLNGMAIVDNRVRYVTTFGATNTAGGWRENKVAGGLLLDVDSGEIVLRGLSMPHSPRQYDKRFFVLESGTGTIATADLATGRVETIAELPGFTRGLAFAGPFAFIGLSQVRESNVFGGIPLTERVAQRQCGVYVVDLRTGQVVAFLRFEGDVQEIFDVQVLHDTKYPELLELGDPLVATSFTLPDEALAAVARG
ncbi:MAG: TIGR03032 family protein [Acidobacteriota bacterium]